MFSGAASLVKCAADPSTIATVAAYIAAAGIAAADIAATDASLGVASDAVAVSPSSETAEVILRNRQNGDIAAELAATNCEAGFKCLRIFSAC